MRGARVWFGAATAAALKSGCMRLPPCHDLPFLYLASLINMFLHTAAAALEQVEGNRKANGGCRCRTDCKVASPRQGLQL